MAMAASTVTTAVSSSRPANASSGDTPTSSVDWDCTRRRAHTRDSFTSTRAAIARAGERIHCKGATMAETVQEKDNRRGDNTDGVVTPPSARVRDDDLQPHEGLRYIAKLFKALALLLIFMLIAEIILG